MFTARYLLAYLRAYSSFYELYFLHCVVLEILSETKKNVCQKLYLKLIFTLIDTNGIIVILFKSYKSCPFRQLDLEMLVKDKIKSDKVSSEHGMICKSESFGINNGCLKKK